VPTTITSVPTASPIALGQALSSSVLTGGSASVAGSFVFTEPTTEPAWGLYTASIAFIPADHANAVAFSTVDVEVGNLTAPSPPREAHVVNAWGSNVAIDWKPPTSTGGLPVHYVIRYRPTGTVAWTEYVHGWNMDNQNVWVNGGVPNLPLVSHEIEVGAVNAHGATWTSPMSIDAVGVVTDVHATQTCNGIDVSWQAPAAGATKPVVSYAVTVSYPTVLSGNDARGGASATVPGSLTSAKLAAAIARTLRGSATGAVGVSVTATLGTYALGTQPVDSGLAVATPLVPCTPLSLSVKFPGRGIMALGWNVPEGFGLDPYPRYVVTVNGPGIRKTARFSSPVRTRVSFNGARRGAKYVVTVKACNAYGCNRTTRKTVRAK
jgi:hypothetical protein